MGNFQDIGKSVAAADSALREQGRKFRAAAEAQIVLPEQIERLNQQTGELLKIAEAQKATADKADAMTRRIVGLTWALVILTAGLFFLTVYLCLDIYQHRQADREAHQSASEQR